jgi:hypothetical protein
VIGAAELVSVRATVTDQVSTGDASGRLGEPGLHPLGVGEVLDTAIKLYRGNAVTMWKIVGVVLIPLAVLQLVVLAASLPSGASVHNGTLYTSTGTLSTPAAGILAQSVLGLLAILAVNGALALCLVDSYLGHPLSWSRSLGTAFRRFGSLLGLAILFMIAIVIAFILVILPGIWLSVAWSVAVPALMVERIGAVKALRRSFRLVRGRWWATFGALLVATIMLLVVVFLVGLVFNALSFSSLGLYLVMHGVSTVVSGLITYPFIGAVVAVIYIDQRVRKEALDLELLAGTSGPGASEGSLHAVPEAG